MRRIALFSDIHGNLPALDAVLADIESSGIDEAYCLGDLVGYGPDPSGVVDRIRTHRVPTILGNYDEGIGQGRGECGCYYVTDQAQADGTASYEFTESALSEQDRTWLAGLPGQIRLENEEARILLAHGSPRKINEYLLLDRKDAQLARLANQAEADVVCVGHVHIPYHRSLVDPAGGVVHYVSSGSVGKPKDGDPRAAWVELVLGTRDEVLVAAADEAAGSIGDTEVWVATVVHRVEYDVASVAAAMIRAGLPVTLVEALQRA